MVNVTNLKKDLSSKELGSFYKTVGGASIQQDSTPMARVVTSTAHTVMQNNY